MRLIDADALKRRAITVRFFGKDIMMVPTAEIDDAPTIDAVSKGVLEQFRWERDVAMAQLEEYGIPFGTKKDEDMVRVVRCKDCKWYGRVDKRRFYRGMDCLQKHINTIVPDRDFCSKAERRGEQDGRFNQQTGGD